MVATVAGGSLEGVGIPKMLPAGFGAGVDACVCVRLGSLSVVSGEALETRPNSPPVAGAADGSEAGAGEGACVIAGAVGRSKRLFPMRLFPRLVGLVGSWDRDCDWLRKANGRSSDCCRPVEGDGSGDVCIMETSSLAEGPPGLLFRLPKRLNVCDDAGGA